MRHFFLTSRRRHTIFDCDWSSDVCSSDLVSSADAVVFLNAIHLVSDKAQVMAEIRKALKPGGVFAFNTTFFNGAYVDGTAGVWRRWIVRAGQVLRERGLEGQHSAHAVARQFLTPGEHA